MAYASCRTFTPVQNTDIKTIPQSYNNSQDSANSASIKWRDFFADKNLVSLIDTALKNNLDLLITSQEIEIAKNDVRLRKGLLFPKVTVGGGVSVDKVGRYTSEGAGDAVTEITQGKLVPDPLNDFMVGLNTSWEVDIWKKLRNSKKSAYSRYLATIEGKNLVLTNLISEIANSYYELLALDNQLDIIRQTIQLQKNGLEIVKFQKEASVVTELAVKKFEAEVLSSQSLEYDVLQKIKEEENKRGGK